MGFLATVGQRAEQIMTRSSNRVSSLSQFPGYTPYTSSYGGTNAFFHWLFNEHASEHNICQATENSIVDICLAYIARNFILAEWQVQDLAKDGKWGIVEAHPVLELLDNPNKFYDGISLWAATASSIATGNAYWILARDATGTPREAWWAPQLGEWGYEYGCTPYRDVGFNNGLPFCYQYRAGGQDYYLPLEDVIHFRLPRPNKNDPFLGWNPLVAQLPQIGVDNQLGEYSESILKNFGVVGAFLINKSGKTLGEDTAEAMKSRYRSNTTGKNRGDINIIPIDFDVKFPDASPEKMAVSEMGDTPEERIPAAMGLNAIAVGLGAGLDKSTYSNNEQATAAAWDQGIAPLHRICAATVSRRLMPQLEKQQGGDKKRFFFDYSMVPAQQEDENELWARATAAWEKDAITLGQFCEMTRQPKPLSEEENLRYSDIKARSQAALLAAQPKPEPAQPAPEGDNSPKAFSPHSLGLKRLAYSREIKALSKDERERIIEQARGLMDGTDEDKRELVAKNAIARMSNTAQDLRNGDIGVPEWSKQSREDILAAHAAQALNGYGAEGDELPEHMWEWFGNKVGFHLEKFDGFESDVLAGRYDYIDPETEKQDGYTDGVVSRQAMYANATRATYENAGLMKGKDTGAKYGARIMAAVGHCAECEAEAAKGKVPIEEVVEIGDSTCKAMCACVIVVYDE